MSKTFASHCNNINNKDMCDTLLLGSLALSMQYILKIAHIYNPLCQNSFTLMHTKLSIHIKMLPPHMQKRTFIY